MIFSDLYGEKLHRELGSEDITSMFTTARRKAAINEAQLEFAKQTECFVKTVTLSLTDDQREYDLEAVITAADFLWFAKDGVEYVFTDADGNISYLSGDDFLRRDLADLNRNEPGWRSATKTSLPDGYYLREDGGKTYLGLKTPPAIDLGETADLTIPYVASPPDMSSDSDEPFSTAAGSDPKKVLRPWHQALVHYAAALLEPLRKNYAGEQRQRGLFAALVADYLQRKRKKGGGGIQLARDYRRDASRRFGGGVGSRYDPRVWP